MPGNKLTAALIFVFFSAVVIVSTAFFWNEARNEIKYLCKNFVPGISMNNVAEQLQTAQHATYSLTQTSKGTSIVFSSPIHFHFYKCVIELDANNVVNSARLY
ncbi:hypothetical protein DXV75_02340 [Alteromonas aestuariivivens]|uniref:Transmembrane protein n=1 Tax=Alteromonas aestuariivivens TaxID=1938339 RepID=A0A3D8MFG0_9ALTE|nr:hypothetical protein [Alteromonas aestuariivivens]RDV29311.1 hypothetical protein DXV75_02340 [Alteromonas aestuariivivens]